MPQNAFFLRTRDLLVSQKTTQRHFFFTLHPLSTVIFATATVLAFVLLRNSRFNLHCYTQREAMPTQKLARKCAATSRNFLRERLQSAFTLANQLCWIAQYRKDIMAIWNLPMVPHGLLFSPVPSLTPQLATDPMEWRERHYPSRMTMLEQLPLRKCWLAESCPP